MQVKPVDYIILLITASITQYTFWTNYPQISSTTALTGLFTATWLLFILYGENIPRLRDIINKKKGGG